MAEIVPANAEVLSPKKVSDSEETDNVKCKQCGLTFKSKKGLTIHIGKLHKTETILPSPEKVRCSSPIGELSLTLTPPLGPRNEHRESVSVKVSEESLPLLKVDEEQDPEKLRVNKGDYPHPQKCCYEKCDLVFKNKDEFAKHIMNHMKKGD